MTTWWHPLLAIVGGIVLLWLFAMTAFFLVGRRYGDATGLRDALRLLPDVVRLLRRLASDQALPRGVRVRIALIVVYLALPIDLVPDFIPVIGFADDIILVALVLRSVARTAGVDTVDRHWPGTEEGLRAIKRLTGLAG